MNLGRRVSGPRFVDAHINDGEVKREFGEIC